LNHDMVKKLTYKVFVFVLKSMPIALLDISLGILYSYTKSKYVCRILSKLQLSKIQLDKLTRCHCKFIKKYHILTNAETSAYKVHLIDGEHYEQIRAPDVYGITKNNFLTVREHEIAIYCFPTARIRANSDIIKIGENVFWEKANRPEFSALIPVDSDYFSIDKVTRTLTTFEEEKIRVFDRGYSLCGVHTSTWAHFVISYLPKIIALDEFNFGSKLSLFVPSKILENSRDLILFALNNIVTNKEIEIVYVEDDEIIECSNLYYCNAIGYLCDHSTYVHPTSCCPSNYGSKAINKVASRIWPTVKVSRPRRLYIGRSANRNLTNAVEVEEYFIQNGFEIVHPHLMSLEEKIDTFGNATHMCGPGSSGFANFIFCKNKVKILCFANFARCFDPFFSGINYAGGFKHEIMVLTGYEEVNNNINNSYLIELGKIISCCQDIKYFE
jgi:hypothetical protein